LEKIMPWREASLMSLRLEFVQLASQEGANVRELCRRFQISPATGYKWLQRFAQSGATALVDQSRRPRTSPKQTAEAVEQAILKVRDEHPTWGARKLKASLVFQGHTGLPAASTVQAVLRRHDRLNPAESAAHKPWHRFEHAHPNALWQMDFKGHFALLSGRCHPLTVLDDHSRYALVLSACANEQGETVRNRLTWAFRRYGLPLRMTMDNGSPWGDTPDSPYTPLTVWLLHLGIRVSHSRPYHPQTQGKDERFHRTLDLELLRHHRFVDLDEAQFAFDRFRAMYNQERPHEALAQQPPVTRYTLSPHSFPEHLPPLEYPEGFIVRKVQDGGFISFRNRPFRLPKAFKGYPIGLKPTAVDGTFEVYFATHRITQIQLNRPT
jgi:transposase InsO family protein